MNILGEGALTGHYIPSDPIAVAKTKTVVGLEFGAPGGGDEAFGRANRDIAKYILEKNFQQDKLIIAQSSVAQALRAEYGSRNFDLVETGDSHSGTLGADSSAYTELQKAREIITAHYSVRPEFVWPVILATHDHLVGRAALHAKQLDLLPVFPPDLPGDFDPHSSQWWCRNAGAWALREIPGSLWLRHKGQM